jgi:hypothetical protein
MPKWKWARRVKQLRTESGAVEVASTAKTTAGVINGHENGHASPAQSKRTPTMPAPDSKPSVTPNGRKRSTSTTPQTHSASASAPPDKLVGRRIKVH